MAILNRKLEKRQFHYSGTKSNKPCEGQFTFAVGHLASGYLTGKAMSKLLNVDVNIPLLFLVSILPDIDLLVPGLEHRGPTHSLVVQAIIFLPIFLLYGKITIPYFVSLAQHSFFGDLLVGRGIQILWPITSSWYTVGIGMTGLIDIYVEWILFLTSLTLMLKAKDIQILFQHHPSNLVLSIPTAALLLPTFLSFPLSVPLELVIPHFTFLIILILSTIIDFKAILTRT